MAQKRMFDKLITNSDEFLELPDSSQVLYFHLSMNADDDGFVNNCKSIMKMTGTKEDDLKILILKSFIIPFETGVIVIKHWRINNYLRNDRYKQTTYVKEMNMLELNNVGEYVLKQSNIDDGIPLVYPDKNSIDNIYIEQNHSKKNDFADEFDILWGKYPNKKGKKDAFKHYTNARKSGISYETIDKGIDNYISFIKSSNRQSQYIMYGSTWFCGNHWEDDYNVNVNEENDDQYIRLDP